MQLLRSETTRKREKNGNAWVVLDQTIEDWELIDSGSTVFFYTPIVSLFYTQKYELNEFSSYSGTFSGLKSCFVVLRVVVRVVLIVVVEGGWA